ncbi:hypothetical protein H4W33_002363 [Kibdelosporangium phytohabitans]|nr:hypothetical protein [Kibdelosporangium phytohabitans]
MTAERPRLLPAGHAPQDPGPTAVGAGTRQWLGIARAFP